MRVGQSGIRVEVTGADYAKCNGEYELIRDWRNPLAPHRPTYKHVSMPRWKYFRLFFKIFHMSRFIYWMNPHYGWTIGPRITNYGFFHNNGMYKNISFLLRKYFKMNKNILLRRSEGTEPTLRAVAGELEKRNQCGLQTSYEARLYRLSWQWTNSQAYLRKESPHWLNLLTLAVSFPPYPSFLTPPLLSLPLPLPLPLVLL